MGESCAELCSGSALFVFNGVDIVFGAALTIYSLYLGVNHYAPEWLFGPILAVGVVLVLTGFMSWCGAAHRSCSFCLSLSSYLLIVLALAELGLGVAIFTQGDTIDAFLREHQQELHLTDAQLRKFEHNKFLPAYALIGLFCMEVLRFCFSSGLSRSRHHNKYRYRSLVTLRDLDDELLGVKKEQEISSKYASLKGKYKSKYKVPESKPVVAARGNTLYV